MNTVEFELALFDTLQDGQIVRSVERRRTTDEDIQNDAHRPDVALFIVIALDNFRGDVIRSANASLHTDLADFYGSFQVGGIYWDLRISVTDQNLSTLLQKYHP